MRRRGGVQRRRIVFIGVEGKSDRAFLRFIRDVCENEALHLHLDVKPATGGDSVAVVEAARRRLKRHSDSRSISRRLVLLDSDRVETDKAAGRDASLSASRWGLEVVFAVPNLEGLLIRLYNGHETRFVSAPDALRQLRKLWPEYGKGALSADQLRRRFALADLRRAARHDEQMRKLLAALGL